MRIHCLPPKCCLLVCHMRIRKDFKYLFGFLKMYLPDISICNDDCLQLFCNFLFYHFVENANPFRNIHNFTTVMYYNI